MVEGRGWRFSDIDHRPPGWQLLWQEGRLVVADGRSKLSLGVDEIFRRARGGNLAIAKACRGARRVHDALAGWGTDAMTLAVLGLDVVATEQDARVHAVLAERIVALRTANPGVSIESKNVEASRLWRASEHFDVVYLDPMFEPHPTTALASGRMQALEAWVAPTPTEDLVEMLDLARGVARVVVKRRRKDPALEAPDWSIRAKAVRFDVYRQRPPIAPPGG